MIFLALGPWEDSHLHPDQIAAVANFDQGVVPKRRREDLHALGRASNWLGRLESGVVVRKYE